MTPNSPAPIGPYNQAVLAGDTLYVSGTIALDLQTNKLMKLSIKDETKQVMDYLGEILKEAGMTYENVVKTSIFLSSVFSNFILSTNHKKSPTFLRGFFLWTLIFLFHHNHFFNRLLWRRNMFVASADEWSDNQCYDGHQFDQNVHRWT